MRVGFDGGMRLEFYGVKVDSMDTCLSKGIFQCSSNIYVIKLKDQYAENTCIKNLGEVVFIDKQDYGEF